MKKSQARELLKVADLIESDKVSDAEFDIEQWGIKRPSCPTKHCILGWACTIPSIKEKGLKLKFIKEKGEETATARITLKGFPADKKGEDFDENTHAVKCGARVFGLEMWEAQNLFLPHDDNATREDAAEKIRSMVEKYFPVTVKKKSAIA